MASPTNPIFATRTTVSSLLAPPLLLSTHRKDGQDRQQIQLVLSVGRWIPGVVRIVAPLPMLSGASTSSTSPGPTVKEVVISDDNEEQQRPRGQRTVPFVIITREKSVLGIILGGGAGTRLYPLTKKRAKPAVPLGANYRLIDIPVSNCLNSNVSKIYVLTQFNSASLNRHLSRAYGNNIGGYKNDGFVEVLAAQQSPENPNWFQGTADAVRQYLWLFEEHNVMEFLILAGDHLYRMDYQKFIQAHRETDADITVAALPMDEERATAFGLMKIDDEGRIVEFSEKPKGEKLKAMMVDTTILGLDSERAKELPYIASMGIYVFSKDAMLQLLRDNFPSANDFGSEVIPGATEIGMRVQAYLYDGYWEDIGTIEAFYNANLGITKKPVPDFSFYDRSAPIYTQSRYLPPSKVLNADVTDSVIGEGCVINTENDKKVLSESGGIPIGIGKNAHIRKAIIDKNARIGENVKIINVDDIQEASRESDGYFIKSGIVTVIKDALIPSGTVI
ncbi:Glucose-1-phosphate adenylyltransferase small subunit, chloroplastic/amyloplastic [Triticum urartu]|uniref:glucose-1-phosphate adenylyltransferase n=1 Tax=Triticum urartu TaxID=4572 RepID=M7ZZH9_TRIUA|nr:Glucose-1-phosphate adenylyltransferase small subunit, chloroplastic/amyloplastic [Triticum urartu]